MSISATILMAKAVIFTGYSVYSGVSYLWSYGDTTDPAIRRLERHTIMLENHQLELQNVILELKKKLEDKLDMKDIEKIVVCDISEPEYNIIDPDPDYDFI
jgi:hypothetical protein